MKNKKSKQKSLKTDKEPP